MRSVQSLYSSNYLAHSMRSLMAMLLFISLGYGQDFDEQVQGESTTVTRDNNCVSEKLKSYNPISGAIPLTFGHLPATDLVCDSDECGEGILKGDILHPEDAKNYFEKRFFETRCQWGLADLNPQEEEDIWENTLGGPLSTENDDLGVQDLDTVDFVSEAWGKTGSYRVTVNKTNRYGTPIQYSVILSKTVHNYILRKSLLRKLGYKIPAIKPVKRLKIRFDSNKQREEFIGRLSVNNAGSYDRWS